MGSEEDDDDEEEAGGSGEAAEEAAVGIIHGFPTPMLPDDNNPVPVLADFLSNVPPPLTVVLLHLAPCISASRQAVEISSWAATWYYSWLALAAWWVVCLFIDSTLRRFLPFVVLAFIAAVQRQRKNQTLQTPTTEQSLRTIITDLTIIQALLPSIPSSVSSVALPKLLRVCVILYVPYLVLSVFIPFRIICAFVGTIVLTWRAPWAIILRAIVWRSAWLRWAVYSAWATLTGDPLPPRTMSTQPSNTSSDTVQSVRFLFTVYENQRWWMGLDWTAALLPGERPSWCSSSQHHVSPPNAFVLPDNTAVYLPDGKGGRLKRTAIWKWEEPEWRVVIHKDGGSLNRVERPLPSPKEETANSSRLIKAAAGRLRDSGITSPTSTENGPTGTASDAGHSAEDKHEGEDEEILTDADGWVYGDNKWEAQSNKGGMGKYTRYRRWTRIAVVFEEVENVSPGEIGVYREESTARPVEAEQRVEPVALSESPTQDAKTIGSPPPDSPLRQRLRMALNK
ncbi:unnamed protein product [Cyclocybe aegerita]|uniref:Peroxin/Ferlin domain-containing protein n=1 Tax=Cyclocybe aegerita TaxID=1973307 RepID=A0A8S0W6L3_CYCAE|nr:unnamed protein product [Cyclocybe aegerita]